MGRAMGACVVGVVMAGTIPGKQNTPNIRLLFVWGVKMSYEKHQNIETKMATARYRAADDDVRR